MQRLISLFATTEHEPRLSRPTSGPPPTAAGPDYDREPVYFEHLILYLREQRRAGQGARADAQRDEVMA